MDGFVGQMEPRHSLGSVRDFLFVRLSGSQSVYSYKFHDIHTDLVMIDVDIGTLLQNSSSSIASSRRPLQWS